MEVILLWKKKSFGLLIFPKLITEQLGYGHERYLTLSPVLGHFSTQTATVQSYTSLVVQGRTAVKRST